jgi:TolA-binding protein
MRIICTMMLLGLALLAGCSSGEKKAAELLETARFEEKQNNFEHAKKLYDEILKNHPASPAAAEAKARSEELGRRKP